MIAKKLILIERDSKVGYRIPLGTLVYLKGLNPNLRVSCVAIGGKAKTGKSYLMNRLFLDASKIKFDVHGVK